MGVPASIYFKLNEPSTHILWPQLYYNNYHKFRDIYDTLHIRCNTVNGLFSWWFAGLMCWWGGWGRLASGLFSSSLTTGVITELACQADDDYWVVGLSEMGWRPVGDRWQLTVSYWEKKMEQIKKNLSPLVWVCLLVLVWLPKRISSNSGNGKWRGVDICISHLHGCRV